MYNIILKSSMRKIAVITALFLTLQMGNFMISRGVKAEAVNDISDSYTFKPVKIGGGGFVTGLIVHPKDSSIVYSRTDVGGAYRWDEETETWTQLITYNRLPSEIVDSVEGTAGMVRTGVYPVDSIGIDPNNKDVLFLAAGNSEESAGYLLKSTDRGETFVLTDLKVPHLGNADNRTQGERIAVDPNNSNIVFYGSRTSGLWKSTNGGLNWSQVECNLPEATMVNSDPTGINQVTIDEKSRIYVSVAGNGVYTSTDGGTNWTQVAAGATYTGAMALAENTVYFTLAGKAYHYDPATGLKDITPSGIKDAAEIAAGYYNKKLVFLTSGSGLKKMYSSEDGGATWKELKANNAANKDAWKASADGAEWKQNSTVTGYLSQGAFVIDPYNTSRIWFSEGMGVWRCDNLFDGTDTPIFYDKSNGIEEMVATDCAANADGGLVTTTWDRIGFYHENVDEKPKNQIGLSKEFSTGTSVEQAADDFNFMTMSVADHRFLGDGNYSGYTTDGGKTWTKFGSIVKSADGMTNDPQLLKFGEVVPSTGDHSNMIWTPRWGGGNGTLYYSKDYGQTWTKSTTPEYTNQAFAYYLTNSKFLAADGKKANTFYMYTYSPKGIIKTTDGGVTWERVTATNVPGWLWHPELKNVPGYEGHLWLASGHAAPNSVAGLWHSTDGGENFTQIKEFTHAWAVGTGKAKEEGGYPTVFVYGVYNGEWGLYRSIDEGKTWDKTVDYPLGLVDIVACVEGDKTEFGKVYIGYVGNSFAYGYINEENKQLETHGEPQAGTLPKEGDNLFAPGSFVEKGDWNFNGTTNNPATVVTDSKEFGNSQDGDGSFASFKGDPWGARGTSYKLYYAKSADLNKTNTSYVVSFWYKGDAAKLRAFAQVDNWSGTANNGEILSDDSLGQMTSENPDEWKYFEYEYNTGVANGMNVHVRFQAANEHTNPIYIDNVQIHLKGETVATKAPTLKPTDTPTPKPTPAPVIALPMSPNGLIPTTGDNLFAPGSLVEKGNWNFNGTANNPATIVTESLETGMSQDGDGQYASFKGDPWGARGISYKLYYAKSAGLNKTNTSYVVSFWYKGDAANLKAFAQVDGWADTANKGEILSDDSLGQMTSENPNEWKYFEYEYNTGIANGMNVHVRFQADNKHTGTICVDNVQIRQRGEGAVKQVLKVGENLFTPGSLVEKGQWSFNGTSSNVATIVTDSLENRTSQDGDGSFASFKGDPWGARGLSYKLYYAKSAGLNKTNTSYVVSFWYRGDAAKLRAFAQVDGWSNTANKGEVLSDDSLGQMTSENPNEWKYFEYEYNPGVANGMNVHLRFQAANEHTGQIFVDNVQVHLKK